MKTQFLGLACAGLMLLAIGCSQPQPTVTPAPGATNSAAPSTPGTPAPAAQEQGFQLAIAEDQVLAFQPAFQKVDLRKDTKHSAIVLGTYDFPLAPMSANSVAPVSAEGQIRVHIGITGAAGANFDNPLPTGEYDASKSYVDIYTFEGGQQKLTNVENEKGTITISSVNDTQVVGSVDITGDKGARVKGDFIATIAK
jgi:hypothetical protein